MLQKKQVIYTLPTSYVFYILFFIKNSEENIITLILNCPLNLQVTEIKHKAIDIQPRPYGIKNTKFPIILNKKVK